MQNSYFCTPWVNSVYDGAAGISFLGPRIHLILIRVGFLWVHFLGGGVGAKTKPRLNLVRNMLET